MGDKVPPLSVYRQRKLDAVMNVAPRVIRRLYRPDCCIAATRVLQLVFRAFNAWARPLSVVTLVNNREWVTYAAAAERDAPATVEEAEIWRDGGAWSVVLGAKDVPPDVPGWPGHVVCVVWEQIACDVSLTQANRPEKGIDLVPVAMHVPYQFLKGQVMRCFRVNGCHVQYAACPGDRSYESAPDWLDVNRHREAVSEIIYHARRKLA